MYFSNFVINENKKMLAKFEYRIEIEIFSIFNKVI